MPRDTLQFAHSTRPPTSDVRVFDVRRTEFLGAEFTFRVVGSSHYVSAPAYDFHELSSCEPVDAPEVTTVPLNPAGESRRLEFETDGFACETVVEPRPLSAFPWDREFDVAYAFDEDAFTAIDLGEAAFETYHTYPEFDLAVYSRTAFERPLPTEGASVATGARADTCKR
jgi:hypothetical protein